VLFLLQILVKIFITLWWDSKLIFSPAGGLVSPARAVECLILTSKSGGTIKVSALLFLNPGQPYLDGNPETTNKNQWRI